MAVVFGFIVFGVVLYLWLAGHWFGRVLGFIPIFIIGVAIMPVQAHSTPAGDWLMILLCAAVSWILASAPRAWKGLRREAMLDAKTDEMARI